MAQLAAGRSPRPGDLVTKGFPIAADNHRSSPSIPPVLVAEASKHCQVPNAFDVLQLDYSIKPADSLT